MKNLFLVLILAGLFACSPQTTTESGEKNNFNYDTTKLAAGTEFYQCPMHPEVISQNPDNCPKCGMALEKIVKQ
jgi:hypothetical protein